MSQQMMAEQPRQAVTMNSGPGMNGEAAPLAGLRILIVEDEALVAMDLEMTLEAAGAEIVGPFATLAAGLAAAEAELIDGALLDVMLGREEVFPIAEALRGRGIGFVFHSGHGNRAELAAAYPNAAFCPKPSAPTSVVREVRGVATR